MSDKSRLRNALDKFLISFNWGELLSNAVKILEENKEIEFVILLDKILSMYIQAAKDIPELSSFLQSVKNREHQAGLSALAGLAQGLTTGMVSSASSPLLSAVNQRMNMQWPVTILDPTAYLTYKKLNIDNPKFLTDQLLRHGLKDSEIAVLTDVLEKRLDAPQLISINHRFPEAFDNYELSLLKTGWNRKHLDYLKMMQYQYPSTQDWILFAVREATNEQRAKELGLDLGDFGIAESEALKSGLAPGYFKYYWRAHWQLPPLTLGYEFLHRFRHTQGSLKFTEQDLSRLIQALDYSPIWHERMMAASYNPITRVDIRRVLKAGKLKEDGVRNAYYKDGYSDDDAELLTDWTMWEAQASMRDLSLARVEEAVEKGIMTELEAQAALEDLRYDPEDIPRYMALWRYDREKKRIDAEVDYLSAQYMNNELTEQDLRSQLTMLGLTPNNVYIAIVNLNAKRKRQITPLSTNEIYQMWTENILSSEEALNELVARGVNKLNAQRQMKLNIIKKQNQTDKEAEEAQDKLEKERAKAITNDKAIALAEVGVQIAELQAEVVDLKVVASDITDIETLTAIEQRQLAIKQELAYLALEKSKITLTFAKELKTQSNG